MARWVNPENLAPSGFFCLRTPLLPFDDFRNWGASLEAPHACDADPQIRQAAWRRDADVLRARLRRIVETPEVRQALVIASPSLESSIEQWILNPETKNGRQTERSLVQYFARMTGRSTPFGLFAGHSVGAVAGKNDAGPPEELVLQPPERYRVTSRVDYSYLSALAASLEAMPEVATHLTYWPSPSLRRQGAFWHYVEPRVVDSKTSYHLVRLEHDEILEGLITRAREGITRQEATATVRELAGSGVSAELASAYTLDVIDAKILVSRLSPLVTGTSALDDLIRQLQPLPSATHIAHVLADMRVALARIDERGLGAPRSDYEAIASTLARLPAAVDLSRLIQVDLVKPLEHRVVSRKVIDELARGLEFLADVNAAPPREPERVRAFRQAFGERYGTAWVPLLEVVDEEAGTGFGAVLLMNDDEHRSGQTPSREELTGFYEVLLKKVAECAGQPAQELVLEASDFATVEHEERFLPGAFSVIASVAASSAAAIEAGNFRVYLLAGGGPSGANLLGRFCHADCELEHLVRTHLGEEEINDADTHDADAIYAEIVHLPEGRGGNIVARPVLRDYEIECFGRSGCPPERRLSLSDLLVTVRDEQVLLYSQRLRKRVIARLTSAHGFKSAACPAAYQLLGYSQYRPATQVPTFRWGPLERLPFLPRVRTGRVILSEARWNLSRKQCAAICEPDRHERFAAVQQLRRTLHLPRWVLFIENGHALPVDLDNALSVDAFVQTLRRTGETTLLEMYPTPDELYVTSQNGRFQHELIVPFITRHSRPRFVPDSATVLNYHAERRSAVRRPERTRHTESEWLCLGFHGGRATLEHALVVLFAPLIRTAIAEGLISSWFFTRESQSRSRLRLRLNASSRQRTSELLSRIHQAVDFSLPQGGVWKMEIDRSERGLERYGGIDGIGHSERVFFADSDAVLTVLEALGPDVAPTRRVAMAMLGADRLLSDCGLDLAARHAAVQRARDVIQRAVPLNPLGKKRLNERFRSERAALETALTSPEARWQTAFDRRSQQVAPVVDELHRLRQNGQLRVEIGDVALAYVHTHINRVMLADLRMQEFIVYDSLVRHYRGQLARQAPSGAALR